MSAKAKRVLRIDRGESFSFTFDILLNGVVLDLTGATVSCKMRKTEDRESDEIVDFGVNVTLGGVTGYLSDITLSLTSSASDLAEREGVADLKIVDASGNTKYRARFICYIDETTS